MGKLHPENGSGETTTNANASSSSTISFCGRRCCPMGGFSFKCLLVLILSLSLFISTLFLNIPSRSLDSGYDASQTVTASVQAYFRLQRLVSQLVPHIRQLEDELDREIGVPDTKVSILSIHKSCIANSTYVVFGFLPHPKGAFMHPVSLSVLKSSLIELFLQESNLTLTSSRFGVPASFEIVKFIGGVTVIPRQLAPVSQIVQTLFNFTLNNSIYDVKGNLGLLTMQLKTGLHLRFDEHVFVQVTNKLGSTLDPPVIVQASVLSDMGSLQPQRLKQLAQTIQNSSYFMNLGLNNTMFGRVKFVSLSSYLSQTLKSNPSSPSPSPEPSLPPCDVYPPYTSAPPSSCDYLSPCSNNHGSPEPSPIGSLPQSPTTRPRNRTHCTSQGASPPSHPPLGSSHVPDLSLPAAAPTAQPPSAYGGVSPSFQPFTFEQFMQGQEKSSVDSLVPCSILGSDILYIGVHLLISVVVLLHL